MQFNDKSCKIYRLQKSVKENTIKKLNSLFFKSIIKVLIKGNIRRIVFLIFVQ